MPTYKAKTKGFVNGKTVMPGETFESTTKIKGEWFEEVKPLTAAQKKAAAAAAKKRKQEAEANRAEMDESIGVTAGPAPDFMTSSDEPEVL